MQFEAGRFEVLRERLLRAGIAPRRVRRYLDELDDHLAELTAREIAAGYDPAEAALRARALLGPDEELAESWLSDPRLKSLTARAPWLVLPAVMLLVVLIGFSVCIAAWLGVAYAGGVLGGHGRPVPDWFTVFTHVVAPAANFLVSPLAMVVLAVLVHRRRLNALWLLIPALVLLNIGLRASITAAPHSLSIGFGFVLAEYYYHGYPEMLGGDFPFPLVAFHLLLIATPVLWLMSRQYWWKPA